MDAKIIRHLKPPQYETDQLVTLSGVSFLFRACCVDGGIRVEFNPDASSIKARIGKKSLPGRPRIKSME